MASNKHTTTVTLVQTDRVIASIENTRRFLQKARNVKYVTVDQVVQYLIERPQIFRDVGENMENAVQENTG